jgi:hypothetical protein
LKADSKNGAISHLWHTFPRLNRYSIPAMRGHAPKMLSFNTKKSTRVATKLRFRKKLSQLLAGVLIAPLFSFIPAVLGPSVLPSAQAVSVGTGNCAVDVASSSGVVAVNSGTFCYLAFTNTDANAFTVPAGLATLEILVIAGGGAGGSFAYGGGGGAGEVAVATNYPVTPGASVSVSVGAGGTSNGGVNGSRSFNGSNSWVGSSSGLVANGGGFGTSYNETVAANGSPASGGSGGGASEKTQGYYRATEVKSSANGGASTTRYAFKGGWRPTSPIALNQAGAGGGGAGAQGGDIQAQGTPGAGGSGTNAVANWLSALTPGMTSITGWGTATAEGFIAGGGGGGGNNSNGAVGGAGGGGRGGLASGVGSAAIANTGSGGGGASYTGAGGAGGSGLIVVRFSNGATLSALALSVGTLSPTFALATTSYTTSVANSVLSTTVTPTSTQVNATITVNGTSVTSGSASGAISLSVGSNVITVVVTAQDGVTTSTYTVMVTRAASSDATLSAASIKGQTATLGIPNVTLGSETAGAITLTTAQAIGGVATTFTKTDAGATISRIVKYATGSSTSNFESDTAFTNSETTAVSTGDFFIIKVTAADATVRFYRVNVTVNSNVATLSALALSAGTLNPTFVSETTSYTASVANSDSSITVTPTSTQANATITVNGTSVTSGSASGAISLSVGSNVITVVVTAQDGVTTSTYTVTVSRAGSNVATLSALALSAGTLNPTFVSETTSYTASVANSDSSITVTPTSTQANATITVNGTSVTSGSASGAISLSVGSNVITVVVTAQDGVTTSTYTVSVTRAEMTITTANVVITAPATGATPQTSTSSNGQFTTTISWSPSATTFAATTAYTATVTITPDAGYTLTGVSGNFFTLNGNAATTANTANSGVFTYLFPGTAAAITIKNVVITAPAAGSTPQTSTTSNGQFTTTISWSPSVTRFAASTSYTATVTVVPVTGRTLTGVTANFFTLNGKAATTGNTANAGVFSYLFGIQNAICFNGSNQWLNLTSNTNLPTGNTAYTIEAFIKTGTSHNGGITSWGTHGRGATAEGQRNTFNTDSSGPGYIHFNSQNPGFVQGRSINDVVFNNTWHHVVAQSDGSNVRIYENGYLVRAATYANNVIDTTNFTIGRNAESNRFFNGCISNLRIVKGVAVYNGTSTTSANFAVPTSALTAIQSSSTNINAITETQTVLLMNRSSSILQEDSSFGYTLNANGSPTTTYFGPFVPSNDATLSASSIKGVTPTLGTPNSNLSSVIAGAVTLAEGQATSTSLASTFTKRVSGATTKVVKYLSGTTADIANFEAAEDLTASTTTTLSNGDYFIIKVTAADLTENYYRITITTAVAITLANVVITAPVTGATPQTSTTSNGQFNTTITWSGAPTTFAAATAYTATVTVIPVSGYTLSGVSSNFFTVNGNAATSANLANAGVFTYQFPATAAVAITTANVLITAPVAGATPQTSTTTNGQFTTTITWSPSATTFAAATAYTATVTVLPVSGRTLTGVTANFFTVNSNAATTGNSANAGVFTYLFPATAASITTANVVITAPVTGATPQTSITSNGQFTTTITWSGTPTTFAGATAYTATVTVTPVSGYTLTGVIGNFFKVNTNAATTGNTANAGVFTYLFPATAASITTANVVITAPVAGATPQTSTTSNGQFTTTITWSGTPTTFAAATAYTATVTVVPEPGHTLTGVAANFFKVNTNAATTGNTANAGVFTYLFPATAASITTANVVITAPVAGATPQTSTATNGQFTTNISWSPSVTTFAAATAYTATVTVVPVSGRTLTGVSANFFTLNGNSATTANTADNGVFTYLFPATAASITTANVVITAPATAATPQTSTTSNGQFTTTITWSPSATTFAAGTAYTATVTVTPDAGYTLTGVIANFFTVNSNAATTANSANAGVFTYLFPSTPASITTANVVITAPVTGATPQTSTTSNGQFTTTITWSPSATTFASATAYTATVTVTPDSGYTLSGVSSNFFTLNVNAATTANTTDNGVFSYLFPATAASITTANVVITAPIAGATPQTSTTRNGQFTTTVTWSGTPTTFAAGTAYTATVTVTPDAGHTLFGVAANFFTLNGNAATSANSANAGVFTYLFPATAASITTANVVITAPVTGGTPQTSTTSNGQFTTTISWSPSATTFAGATAYTATVTVTPDAGYTLTGVSANFFTVNGNTATTGNTADNGVFTYLLPATAASIATANVLITAPVTGATPQTSTTSNGQFTTTITWSGTPATFAGATAYTATVTVTPDSGYTLTGVSANFFTLNGNAAASANTADNGVFTYLFPATAASVTTANVVITAPVAGAAPQTSTTSNGQFTTTISWSPSATTFAAGTAYTATVTVTPDAGYTLTGVSANFFTVNGNAATTANTTDNGAFTYLFPATAASITTANVVITTPATGATPQTSTTSNGQFTTTISWSPSATTFAAATAYTATVTVTPDAGYTLTGVSGNFFTVNSNAATTANTADNGVFSYIFPSTPASITTANVVITAPVAGATPQTSTTSNGQFTTTITWSPSATTFAAATAYTATVTVVPVTGRTLTGVSANFFTLNGNSATTANTADNGVFSYLFPATAATITTANVVITAPATAATPQTSTTSNGQFTTTITWSGTPTTFAGATAYTATITVAPVAGYTLSGVSANFFTLNGSAATTGNTANAGVFTYLFPATAATITTANVVIAAPVTGATPQTSTTSNGQFTTTITWSPSVTTFAADTAYRATVTVIPVPGRTLAGVAANFFTLNGKEASTGNAANAGVFSYFFGIQNGSFAVSSGGSALIALGSNFNVSGSFTWPNRFSPNDGYTLETWVKFSSVGTDNLIFRGWSAQGPIPGVAVAGNPRKIAFDYNWKSDGKISWTPSQLGDSCERTSGITPVANTWYHFAATNGTYSGQGTAVSRIFVNGTQVATCTPNQRQNGEIHWIQMGGSSSQAAKFGATRFSKSPRYSASFTPTVVYPTTADSNVIALFNTPYDDANSTTSCFVNADPNSYGGSFIALTGTTLTGTRTCSNDAKVLPPTISNLSNLYGSTAGGNSLTVTGTNLSSTTSITVGGNPATNLQVLSDTSVSFITPAGAAGAASIVVTNSEGSATYTGFAYASVPSPPTGLSASPGGLSASISFTPGSQGGAPISNYKYSLDGGAFTALSPAQTTSPVTISGLSAEQSYTIKLKAVNAAGDSVESEAVTVTPVVAPITIANAIITAPVTGATPQTSTTSNGQFTTTITWSGTPTTFAGATAYTATVTLVPGSGYTLNGVAANFFTVNGNAATTGNTANAGVFTYLFPATAASIATANVLITAPATGGTPQTSTTSNGQFTTTITWSPSVTTFAAGTAYTATVTVAPVSGYTLSGVSANFFTVNGNAATSANLVNAGVFTYLFPATAASITTANVVITAPVAGATPQSSTATNGQFTTTITWSGTPTTFAAATAYTATVTIIPDAGRTLFGVAANFFTLNGNAATSANLANAGVFTYLFPATAAVAITTANVVITAPVTGATPQTSTTSNGQFTTTITWSPSATTFAAGTAYTATITVVPVSGRTLTGVTANFFTLNGNAATSANLANAGLFTYLFPATAALAITTANVVITAPVSGATPQTSTTSNGQFTTTITWSPTATTFASYTTYTANVTVVPVAGRTLAGVAANFFTINGNVATTGNTADAGVFSYQFPRTAFTGGTVACTTGSFTITSSTIFQDGTNNANRTCSGTAIIPEGVTLLDFASFSNLTGLTSVQLPSTLLTINTSAFSGSGLTSITIPSTVTAVGGQAFQNCLSLRNVTVVGNASTGTSVGSNAFNGTSLDSLVLGVDTGKISIFVGSLSAVRISSLTIGAGLTSIPAGTITRPNDRSFDVQISTFFNYSPAVLTGTGFDLLLPRFTLSSSSAIMNINTAFSGYTITGNTRNATGTAPSSYSISPSLSAGLNFDTTTGLISGTATAGAVQTAYTITGTNGNNQKTATFTLTVNATSITTANVVITSPATGATPQTSTTSNGQFTTTITWSGTPTTFAAGTAYTATVTVAPNAGYVLSGVAANFFTLNGNSATTGNSANAGVFTYLFPATAPAPTITNLDQTLPNYGTTVNVTGTNLSGATVVKIGNTPVATFTVVSATSLSFVVNSPCCTAATISITTPGGTATSVATITPQPQLAVIATQPIAVSKNVGQSVTFSVSVTALLDGGVLSYQWFNGTTPIQGATSATFTFTPTAVTQAGNYYVAVYNTLSGSTSLVASNTAALTLNKATPILSTFANVNKTFGDAPFTITAPTSSVPGSFSYGSGTTSVATVDGSTITIVGQGSSVITATLYPSKHR